MTQEIQKTALLIMDVQPGIVERLPNKEKYLENIQKAIDTAHQNQIPVIFVVVGFRHGAPEATGNFAKMASSMINPQPTINPTENDIVVTKKRISAFTGSDLEVLLRSLDIKHLVLCGIATSGVVLSTTREAFDKDYKITILSDLCADMDSEVHQVLIGKIFPRQATVHTLADWSESF
jgi:nicotinamidase-related amidase